MRNITIRQKMMLFILGFTIVTYVVTIGYIGFSLREKAIEEAQKLADSYALQKANDIKATIAEDMAIAREVGAQGTPAFIIGSQFIPGYVGEDGLKSIIAEERAKLAE